MIVDSGRISGTYCDILGASIDLENRGNVVDYTQASYPQALLSPSPKKKTHQQKKPPSSESSFKPIPLYTTPNNKFRLESLPDFLSLTETTILGQENDVLRV